MRTVATIATFLLGALCVFGGEPQPNPNDGAAAQKELEKKLLQRIEEEKAAIERQRQQLKAKQNDPQPRDNRDGARNDGQRAEDGRRPDDGRRDDGRQNVMPKVHAKLADGTELEIDGPLLMMPGMGQQLLDRIIDPAKDGILTFRIDRDLEPGFNLEKLKESVTKFAPHVNMEIAWIGGGILVVTSDSVGELRKALAIIRATKQPQMPGMGPPPGGDRMQRGQPGEQPKRERKEDPPGQF